MPSLLVLALAFQTPTYGLPPDSLLDRPLAMEARIEALPDLLARVGKELGVSLTVERRMTDLKATVLTGARPARLTLTGLASVFDAEWTPLRGGGYQLGETIPARGRREAYLDREEAFRRARVETWLTRTGPVPEFVPTGDAKRDEGARRAVDLEARMAPLRGQLVAAFATLSPSEGDRFWRGELLHFSGRREASPEERTPAGSGTTLTLVQYDGGDRGLRIATIGPEGGARELVGTAVRAEEPSLADAAFRKAQRDWATSLVPSTAPEMARPLKPVPAEPPRWANGRFASDDVLYELYRRSGVPVVAEANRRILSTRLTVRGSTLGEALQSGALPSGTVRLEAGALLHRPGGFWQARRVEPPEALLAAFDGEKTPGLDAWAALYAGLSRPEMMAIRLHVSRHDLGRTDGAKRTLRLWGRLPVALRARLIRGEKVPVESLSPEIRAVLTETVVDGVFEGEGRTVSPAGSRGSGETVPRLLGLLGRGPSGTFTLAAETNASERPPLPPGVIRSGGRPDRRGLVLELVDETGGGLRFFASEPGG